MELKTTRRAESQGTSLLSELVGGTPEKLLAQSTGFFPKNSVIRGAWCLLCSSAAHCFFFIFSRRGLFTRVKLQGPPAKRFLLEFF